MAAKKRALPPTPTPFQISDLAQQFLDLVAEERAAFNRVCGVKKHEGNAVYQAAVQTLFKAQDAAQALAKSISEGPTRDLSDVVAKALVVREYSPRWEDGTIIDLTQPDLDLTASARTILGILSLAGIDDAPVRPVVRDGPLDAEKLAQRIAQRRSEDPDKREDPEPEDAWRIFTSEHELIKLEALSLLMTVLGDAFEQREHEASIIYISDRMAEHCKALRTILFGGPREIARQGGAR